MKGTFAAGLKDGKMRVVLNPEDNSQFAINSKEKAIAKIKSRMKVQKNKLSASFAGDQLTKELKKWTERTQARFS